MTRTASSWRKTCAAHHQLQGRDGAHAEHGSGPGAHVYPALRVVRRWAARCAPGICARLAAAVLVALLLAGCSAAPPNATPTPSLMGGSCSLNLPPGTPDDNAIRAVIDAEGQLVVAQQIDALMTLWADGAYVADAKHTPDNQQDDQYWRDKDAIRHRYVRIVFPGAPKTAVPADLQITREGDRATVRATTHIGSEVSPSGDRWVLVRQGACWLIESLTYNLEPAK